MMYISEELFEARMKKITKKNESKARRDKLRKAKKYGVRLKSGKPSTSHMALWAVIILFTQIVWFAEDMIRESGDMSQLYSLIGIPVALVPVLMAYFSKSAKENTVGGIVYEKAMSKNDSKNETDGSSEAVG